MKRIKFTALCLISTALGITNANASCIGSCFPSCSSLPCGWYLEGNIGNPRISGVTYGTNTTIVTNNAYGWNVNGGFKFMPYFGIDFGYTRYSTSNIQFANANIAQVSSRYSYQLAAKGIVPVVDSGLEFFAKMGIARLKSTVKVTDTIVASAVGVTAGTSSVTTAYYGLGASYNFTPTMAFVVQWNRAKGNSHTGTMDLFSIGVNYIFPS